jgi:hypothetical protein
LDSIVSSIAYARLLAATRSSGSTVILPLVNIPRKDWPLRTEAAYLFRYFTPQPCERLGPMKLLLAMPQEEGAKLLALLLIILNLIFLP